MSSTENGVGGPWRRFLRGRRHTLRMCAGGNVHHLACRRLGRAHPSYRRTPSNWSLRQGPQSAIGPLWRRRERTPMRRGLEREGRSEKQGARKFHRHDLSEGYARCCATGTPRMRNHSISQLAAMKIAMIATDQGVAIAVVQRKLRRTAAMVRKPMATIHRLALVSWIRRQCATCTAR
jgi:hypothetical protein